MTATPRTPRYATLPDPTTGLHRIVCADGTPLSARPAPATLPDQERDPDPAPERPPVKLNVEALLARAAIQRERLRHAGTLPPNPEVPTCVELRARRQGSGFSQVDVATAAGVARSLVAEIERGRRNAPEPRRAIGKALDRLGVPAYRREEA